jgi:catalase
VLQLGASTPVFVRFSLAVGKQGSSDSARAPRGFAMKAYTDEGIWDLVGNNTPVFFIRDGIKFPDFIHSQLANPATNLPDPAAVWDFWSLAPESTHQVTILFSDRGIPASYRHMDGFGSHTFSLVDAQGRVTWVKFHLKTRQGIQNQSAQAAAMLGAEDPEHATRDLSEAIGRREFPTWDLKIQVMTRDQADAHPDNPFDVTKVWSQKDYPLIPVGVLELNRNPTNYFEEVEQAAFSPGHVVPGIGFSPDKVLQARLFAYGDAQRYRLGANHQQLAVNQSRSPVATYERDGQSRNAAEGSGAVNYEPNSRGGPASDEAGHEPAIATGDGDRYDPRVGNDDFTQAGSLFRLLDEAGKARLVENIVASLHTVPETIQARQLTRFAAADLDYGRRVAEALLARRFARPVS